MQGLSAPKIEGKFSLRAPAMGVIVMDGVEGPEKNVLLRPFGCLNSAWYGLSWDVLGAAEFCFTQPGSTPRQDRVWHLAGQELADSEEAGGHAHCDRARPSGLPAVSRVKDQGKAGPEMACLLEGSDSCGKALDTTRQARDARRKGISNSYRDMTSREPGGCEHLRRYS